MLCARYGLSHVFLYSEVQILLARFLMIRIWSEFRNSNLGLASHCALRSLPSALDRVRHRTHHLLGASCRRPERPPIEAMRGSRMEPSAEHHRGHSTAAVLSRPVGSVNWKVAPLASLAITRNFPPWASMIDRL